MMMMPGRLDPLIIQLNDSFTNKQAFKHSFEQSVRHKHTHAMHTGINARSFNIGHNKRAFYDSQAFTFGGIKYRSTAKVVKTMIRHSVYRCALSFHPIILRPTLTLLLVSCSHLSLFLSTLETLPEHYKTSDKIKVANDAFLQVLHFLCAISRTRSHIAHTRSFHILKNFSVCKNFASYLFETSLEVLWRFALSSIARTQNALSLPVSVLFSISLSLWLHCFLSHFVSIEMFNVNHFLKPNIFWSEKFEMKKTNEIIFMLFFCSIFDSFCKGVSLSFYRIWKTKLWKLPNVSSSQKLRLHHFHRAICAL